MRDISIGALSGGALLFAALILIAIGPPRHVPLPPAPATYNVSGPSEVTGGGITLASTSVDLADDDAVYPDGPHADVINASCTACHSASMALAQPRLSSDQWKSIVEKMRDTYKAPVPEAAVPDIVTYLASISAKLPASGAAPLTTNDRSGGTG